MLTRYRGDTYTFSWSQAAVSRNGEFTPVRFEYEYDFHYGALNKKPSERVDNLNLFFLQTITAPGPPGRPGVAGARDDRPGPPAALGVDVQPGPAPGAAWLRTSATTIPAPPADGLRTNDDFAIFSGATDRYDWTLVGKKRSTSRTTRTRSAATPVKMADVLKPNHVNQDARATSCIACGSSTRS
jgi:hypothetical protein